MSRYGPFIELTPSRDIINSELLTHPQTVITASGQFIYINQEKNDILKGITYVESDSGKVFGKINSDAYSKNVGENTTLCEPFYTASFRYITASLETDVKLWKFLSGTYKYYNEIKDYIQLKYPDYFCCYFNSGSNATHILIGGDSSGFPALTSSFTLEAWVWPIEFSSSMVENQNEFTSRKTIFSQSGSIEFGVNYSGSVYLYASGSSGIIINQTSSATIVLSESWSHIAVKYSDLEQTGSFWCNGVQKNSFYTTKPILFTDSSNYGILGAARNETTKVLGNEFKGYIHEFKAWHTDKSNAFLSGNYRCPVTGSSTYRDEKLADYYRFLEGQNTILSSSVLNNLSQPITSGAIINNQNYTWVPCWNKNFYHSASWKYPTRIKVGNIPSSFYGKHIISGSFDLSDTQYTPYSRSIQDDGEFGLIYRMRENHKWARIGHIFPSEGIFVLTCPTMYDIMNVDAQFQLQFKGHNKIPTKAIDCLIPVGKLNASRNETFAYKSGSIENTERRYITTKASGSIIYITGIGLYNEEKELIAVAKLAQPIKKTEGDEIVFRIKYDF